MVMRVAAINDLSCFGRCALTVVIPTLSAMGIQVVPIPTALLSTHTGGFTDLHFRDLGEDMKKISEHFDKLGLEFDAIYSGFLGSAEQIDTVIGFIDRFGVRADGKRIPVLVDPVMGDDGRLYSTYNSELVEGVRRLCGRATLITPNLTEACILTGAKYPAAAMGHDGGSGASGKAINTAGTTTGSEEDLDTFAAKAVGNLRELFGADTVLTGVPGDGIVKTFFGSATESGSCGLGRIECNYPGTGDIFSSVLLGCILRKKVLRDAVATAQEFTAYTMKMTLGCKEPTREGVLLEACLPELIRLCRDNDK